MSLRLALINPWIHDFAAVNLWSQPLGLMQVAEFLSTYTRDLVWIDCLAESSSKRFGTGKYPKHPLPTPSVVAAITRAYGRYGIAPAAFRAQLRAALPLDAILMTSLMTYWYPGVQEAIRICKDEAPNTPVILGGLYARLFPEHAAQHSGADLVYTRALGPDLLDSFRSLGLELSPRFPAQRFFQLGLRAQPSYAPLLTTQGCPFGCPYCASSLLHPHFTQRPHSEIITELESLHTLGVTDIAFYDDALLYAPETHIQPLLEAWQKKNHPLRFHTPNGVHAAYIDARTAELLYQNGFKTLRLSLETTNPERQASSGGKIHTARFEEALAHLNRAGFSLQDLGVYLLFGLPGQPWNEVEDSVDYLMRLGVRIHLNEYSPIPGTVAWEDWMSSGTAPADPDPLLTNNSVFSWLFAPYPQDAIRALKERVAQHHQAMRTIAPANSPSP